MKLMNTIAHPIGLQKGGDISMASSAAAKKVIVEFPEELLRQTEKAAAELSTDRSKLIRSAVETFLEDRAKMRLKQELAEGYRNFATLDVEIAKEFAFVDAEDH
jgi:metal-responsive CopG/Arc/MetJ family transcriptional regulator